MNHIKVNDIITNGGNEISIMIALLDHMPAVRALMNSTSEKELNRYCDLYKGFYRYMKILEDTATAIASGSIRVPE